METCQPSSSPLRLLASLCLRPEHVINTRAIPSIICRGRLGSICTNQVQTSSNSCYLIVQAGCRFRRFQPLSPCRAAEPNAALALVIAYAAFYIRLDAFAGLSWALTTGLMLWLSSTAFQIMVSICHMMWHVALLLALWLPPRIKTYNNSTILDTIIPYCSPRIGQVNNNRLREKSVGNSIFHWMRHTRAKARRLIAQILPRPTPLSDLGNYFPEPGATIRGMH